MKLKILTLGKTFYNLFRFQKGEGKAKEQKPAYHIKLLTMLAVTYVLIKCK